MRGGLAIDGGIERENDFAHLRLMGARDERVDTEILRADAIERRQRAAEHVIASTGGVRPLQRPEIGDVRNDHDDRAVAARIGAYGARILRIDIAASLAD